MLRICDFDTITISAIAKRAQISRQTFYTYYPSIFELTTQIIDEYLVPIQQAIDARIDLIRHPGNFKSTYATIAPMLAHRLIDNRMNYLALRKIQLGKNGFNARLEIVLTQKLRRAYESNLDELTQKFIAYLLLAELDYIFDSGKLPSPEVINDSIRKIQNIFRG